jgi:hypothetical protein
MIASVLRPVSMPMAQNLVEANALRALSPGRQDVRVTYAVITEFVNRYGVYGETR